MPRTLPAAFPVVDTSAMVEASTITTGTHYDAAAHSDATRNAYASDVACFGRFLASLPVEAVDARPEHVAAYIARLADEGHSAATIDRRLVAIRALYRAAGRQDITRHDAVSTARRGIRRTIGTAQRQARPVLVEDLAVMLRHLPADTIGVRDRALILLGFAGAFRRAELVALTVADLEHSDRGILVHVRRSKTDQEGAGRTVAIPHARAAGRCPVRAVKAWLELAGITSGPLFRPVNRHGQISPNALSDKAVALVVQRAAEGAGMDPKRISGHSLRSGLATSAALAGADERAIMAQTGHRSSAMVRRYIRVAEQWTNNAAGAVL